MLEKIWADWEKFASYAFNKSHATCYSWVAFQTAYLKANYPAEYMAAVLSRNINDITKLTNFMDECKAMKISVKGPDVNESIGRFGVNQAGDIRFGLAAIKGIGVNVVEGIIKERNEGGPFTSIHDFIERVDMGCGINRRTIESLALAGAFDCFTDIKREDFFETNNRDESFSEQLVRYGQLFQRDKQQQAASLFDDVADQSLTTAGRPPVKPAVPWPDAERLAKERELVGMYLSAHPLDPYYMDLTYGTTSIKDFTSEEAEPVENKEIKLGGMVTDFQTRTSKNGDPFGILRLEDLTGSTELRLFGRQFSEFNGYGVPGSQILVVGKFQRRFANGDLRFNISRIGLLSEERGSVIRGIVINVDAERVNETLCALMRDHSVSTDKDLGELRLRIYDSKMNRAVTLNSGLRIPVNRALINMLNDLDIEFTILKR